jgi:ABC-2 type transport system ATP-binding protein
MDEPTTGLDPRSKKEVQAVLETLRTEREITVLLCTHDMDEAASLCDRVLMMDAGRVLADDSPGQLRLQYDATSLEAVFMQLTGKTLEEEDEPAEVAK